MRLLYSLVLLALFVYSCKVFVDYLDLPYLFIGVDTRKCMFIERANGAREPCDHFDVNQKYIRIWGLSNESAS